MMKNAESLTIRQVANGWVIHGKNPADVLHVAVTPSALADAVAAWAVAGQPADMEAALPNGAAVIPHKGAVT